MTPICACGKEVSPEKLAQIKKAFNERENDMLNQILKEFRETFTTQEGYWRSSEGTFEKHEAFITRIHTEAYAAGYKKAVEDAEVIVKETKWDEYWTKGTCGEEGRMHNRDVEVVLGQLQSLKHK